MKNFEALGIRPINRRYRDHELKKNRFVAWLMIDLNYQSAIRRGQRCGFEPVMSLA